MRKELLTTVCALSVLLGATSAFAGAYGEPVEAEEAPAAAPAPAPVVEPEMDCAKLGPYLGLGGVYAVELFDDQGSARTDNSGGYHVQAGYRFHQHAAVEARFEHYLDFDLDPGHIEAYSITINGKAYLLTGRFQPYALAGMGFVSGNGSAGNNPAAAHPSNGFALRFGGGLEACITEHISAGPEFAYLLPTGSANDLDMFTVSLGLAYKF